VANAIAVRKGSKESCNSGLTKVADTDNHIVLIDRVLRVSWVNLGSSLSCIQGKASAGLSMLMSSVSAFFSVTAIKTIFTYRRWGYGFVIQPSQNH